MGNAKIKLSILCPICGQAHIKESYIGAYYQSFPCCDTRVSGAMINGKAVYGKALFKIGEFSIEGNRERTKIRYKGTLQEAWIDVRHFIGLSEPVLLKMFLNGRWEPLTKFSILK